jgi:hypothetical protein
MLFLFGARSPVPAVSESGTIRCLCSDHPKTNAKENTSAFLSIYEQVAETQEGREVIKPYLA